MDITRIAIHNFKTMYDCSFAPGKVNVFIGANGSGKSTILESIGILSAAMTDRVNELTLRSKGIRISAPNLYKSKFKTISRSLPAIDFEIEWEDDGKDYDYMAHLSPSSDGDSWKYLAEKAECNREKIYGRSNRSQEDMNNDVGYFMLTDQLKNDAARNIGPYIQKYCIYQPDTMILRGNTADPVQNAPMGLGGGRMAEAVEDILTTDEEGNVSFGNMDVEDILDLIDWAQDFHVTSPKKTTLSSSVPSTREIIEFEDKYLKNASAFTGYDASEGALYVLFMLTLAMHPETPKMFAVDSFDHALNPRLARRLTRMFCEQILETNRTVFLTTHNPLVLDGLTLNDDRIRLFTVSRDGNGYARIDRIKVNESLLNKNLPLSRLWIDGYIGGVPNLL